MAKNKNEIRIFGKEFVKNNKNICKIEIKGKEQELQEKYRTNNYNILEIKLIGIKDITDMSYIFMVVHL